MKAVIDEITEGKAVLLVGAEEQEYVIDASLLPKEAKERDWLQVKLTNDDVVSISLDQEETGKVKSRVEDKLAKLKAKGGSKFRK
ncbi:hypothetical protein GGQ84_002941 [Desulfitispora alkaliphila]|uniref:DUF3006 domain-containing protein n=1 Tax=Desulfitispora alkaliphila TaxID=622674 RepID=UPI003D248323